MFDGFGLVVTQIAVVAGAAALFGLVLGRDAHGAPGRPSAHGGAGDAGQGGAPGTIRGGPVRRAQVRGLSLDRGDTPGRQPRFDPTRRTA